MPEAEKVDKVEKNIRAELMVFTEDQKMMTFSEPDTNGFRTIIANDGSKRTVVLWGSWDGPIPQEGERLQCSLKSLKDCRPEIEVGHYLIFMMPVPSFPRLEYPMIPSKPVKSIYVKKR